MCSESSTSVEAAAAAARTAYLHKKGSGEEIVVICVCSLEWKRENTTVFEMGLKVFHEQRKRELAIINIRVAAAISVNI
jgi:hypothetical protein